MEAQPEDLPCENESCSSPTPTVFPCETCGFLFSAQEHLQKHRLSKHPQLPQARYCCTYCSYSNNHKAKVTRHERVHSGERPFMCDDCGKRFAMRHHISIHSLVHWGGQPHVCADCGQCFSQERSLGRHRREQHSVKGGTASHICLRCGKVFRRRDTLTRHLLKHKEEPQAH